MDNTDLKPDVSMLRGWASPVVPWGRRLPLLSRAIGLGVAVVGAWYLFWWMTGAPAHAGLASVTIKTNTALCLVLLGASLAAGRAAERTPAVRILVVAPAAFAALVGALTLLENAFGWDLGIDQLLAAEDPGALGVVGPNRMGVPAALGTLLTGLSVVLQSWRPGRMLLAHGLAMVVVLVGLLAMMGYVYQVPALYGIAGLTGIARATALALIALGAALLCVRPEEGLMAAITADNPGGHLLRRLLAPVMVVPFAMGWVQLHGERRGWFEDGMGTGLLMLFFIVSFSALLLANVRRVNRWAAAQAETQAERERLLDTIAADGEQLRAGNERLRSMFDSAGASIAQVDLDRGRFVRVNGEFSRMTGYAESDLLKMSLVDVTHPDDRPLVEEGLARARSGAVRGGYFAERRYVRADGRIIEVELHGSVVRDASDRPIEGTIVVIDVTARKRAERDLAAAQVVAERARAAAEQASEAKDHFLSVLSHELRTPLTPVLTGVSLLEGEALSARGRTILEVIQRNVELEARLIDDLLDLTRIARGKVMLDRRPQDLCTVLDQAVEVCQADIHARDLRLSIDYGPRPYIVNADAARVQQVLWNLLKNAVKFTPPGGGIHVRLRPLGGEVVVEVADSGIGIEPSAIETIFDAFAQAERSITRQYGGLGLGLAISRTLVELHGGRIEARSPGRGRGATFAVRLPLLSHGEPRAVEAIRERAREPAVHRPLRILLVEDHGDTADLMSTMLHQAGHTVESAADVTTALDTVARREFDLLISDLGLPDRSGLDLMRELRARGRQLPGIALSGYGQDRDIQESRAAGFAAHLVKPAEPQALLQAIERVSG